MNEKTFLINIVVDTKKRLTADAKDTFIRHIERILAKYGIERDPAKMYPREYSKDVKDSDIATTVRTDLEKLGFKFKRTTMHSPTTNAMSATGIYRTLEYIVDIVFRHNELKVDVYF